MIVACTPATGQQADAVVEGVELDAASTMNAAMANVPQGSAASIMAARLHPDSYGLVSLRNKEVCILLIQSLRIEKKERKEHGIQPF